MIWVTPLLVSTALGRYVRAMHHSGFSCRASLAAAALLAGIGCSSEQNSDLSAAQKAAIADSLKTIVVAAYDLTRPDPVASLMSLYPSDSVVSASAGAVVHSRRQLEQQIKTFWTYVGSNMQKPKWEWTSMKVDVLSPDAAAMTSTYRIPHTTPRGETHILGGAWTAVFARRDGRWVIVQEHLSDTPGTP